MLEGYAVPIWQNGTNLRPTDGAALGLHLWLGSKLPLDLGEPLQVWEFESVSSLTKFLLWNGAIFLVAAAQEASASEDQPWRPIFSPS